MEKRQFGKTGLESSILGFGGFHLVEIPYRDAEQLLQTYLDAGGNYIETAAGYGDGESEMKIGKAISRRRQEYILASKSAERKAEGFYGSIEKSLTNLKTDHLDLVFMHAVGTMGELETLLAPGGAMDGYLKAKEEGKVRNVGISMHGQPDVLIRALQQYPFDAVMTTINYYDRFNFPEIEEVLVPLAKEKGTAIVLMKPVADGLLWKSAEPAFRYAFDRPVSVVVAGTNNRDMLEADLRYAENFKPMSDSELQQLFDEAPELGEYVCRQCGMCLPCPEGIQIPEIFQYEGYFDRQMADGVIRDPGDYALRERLRFWFGNREMAREKYAAMAVKADRCTHCGRCTPKCPYGIDIPRKLDMADYKLAGRKFY